MTLQRRTLNGFQQDLIYTGHLLNSMAIPTTPLLSEKVCQTVSFQLPIQKIT